MAKKGPETWFTHDELCEITAKWVHRNMNMKQVFIEHRTACSSEIVDVLGMRSDCKRVIAVNYEIKVTRSDFLSDRSKPHRNGTALGIGAYRFYVCPKDVIKPEDLPKGWGLIHVSKGGRFKVVVGPRDWKCLYHADKDRLAERINQYWHPDGDYLMSKRESKKHGFKWALKDARDSLRFYWDHDNRDCMSEAALLFAAMNQYNIAKKQGIDLTPQPIFRSPLRQAWKEKMEEKGIDWRAEEKEFRE